MPAGVRRTTPPKRSAPTRSGASGTPDALASLAIGNFLEMRDKTASKTFLLGKRVEKLLARLFPGRFVPLYYMVTFSRTPYADAVRRAQAQWRAVCVLAGLALVIVLVVLAARPGAEVARCPN